MSPSPNKTAQRRPPDIHGQVSTIEGITWDVMANGDPENHCKSCRLRYGIPEDMREAVLQAIHINAATHLVRMEVLQMDSSMFGHQQWLCVGPSCTSKTPGEVKRTGDVPSRFHYPVAYCEIPDEVFEQETL